MLVLTSTQELATSMGFLVTSHLMWECDLNGNPPSTYIFWKEMQMQKLGGYCFVL